MSAGRVIDYNYNFILQTFKEREEKTKIDLKEVVVVEYWIFVIRTVGVLITIMFK